VKNGTLTIKAIHEKYLNKEFTSAKITTKNGFTYGRFEIRAALPVGKMLRPAIFMIPVTLSGWPRNGQIDIMANNQSTKLGAGLHYGVSHVYDSYKSDEFSTDSNLNHFHTYSIEWSESEFKWFFDDMNHLTIDINRNLGSDYTRNGQPFDQPFRLLIHLGVGPMNQIFFPNQSLTAEDAKKWKVPFLMIDYVRIYNWDNGLNSSSNNVSLHKMCKFISVLIVFGLSYGTEFLFLKNYN
jgi:beta-glucanase (GH16 family)